MAQQSYEVVIEGEPVIVPGDALKPMRSKKGYYRLLYQDKLFVLHSSEIRSVDRLSDTDDDLTPALIPQNNQPYQPPTGQPYQAQSYKPPPVQSYQPPYQPQQPYQPPAPPATMGPTYNVRIEGSWVKLPLSAVVASREKPGYYNVTLAGKLHSVSAVNVIPDNYGSPGSIHGAADYSPVYTSASMSQIGYPASSTVKASPSYAPPLYQAPIPPVLARQPAPAPVQPAVARQPQPAPVQPAVARQPAPAPVQPVVARQPQPAPVQPVVARQPQPAPIQPAVARQAQLAPPQMTYAPPQPVAQPTYQPVQQAQPAAVQPPSQPAVEAVTEQLESLQGVGQQRAIRRESYTVEQAEQVSVLVGGRWRTIPSGELKPSKKRPGTFIARVEGRSVRLTTDQISPVVAAAEEKKKPAEEEQPAAVEVAEEEEEDAFHVFMSGTYMNIKASQIEDAPNRPGFKVIAQGGLKQAIHENFVFPLTRTEGGELVPAIPDNYRVFLTPEGVTVTKENIKPDPTQPNTFMVLYNGMIYKLSAENLQPIIEANEAADPSVLPQKSPSRAASEVRATSQRASVSPPKKSMSRASSKGQGIPERPKGKFPSLESDGELPGEDLDLTGFKKQRGSDIYKVKYNGITMHLPSYRVMRDESTGNYRVTIADKSVLIKRKDITLVTNPNGGSLSSVRNRNNSAEDCDMMRRSPFRSPISWDKRLRCSSKKGNVRPNMPRWKGTSHPVNTNKSKKLILRNMMVPSKDEKGKFYVYGTPGTETDPSTTLLEFISDQSKRTSVSEERETDGRTSVTASETCRTETSVGGGEEVTYSYTATSVSPSEKPYITHDRSDKGMLVVTPGVPVLQDSRVLAGANARANMDWVRSLRH